MSGARVAVALLATFLALCDAPPVVHVAAQPPRTSAPPLLPGTLRAAAGTAEREARAALTAGELARADRIVTSALRTATPEVAGRLRWLLADVAEGLGDTGRARTALEPIERDRHALAPWAALRRAELLEVIDPTAALAIVEPLRTGWAGAERASIAHARFLIRARRPEEAIPELRACDVHLAAVAMPLGDALCTRSDDASRVEALTLYRGVAARFPDTTLGDDAAARARALLASFPASRRRALSTPSESELRDRAQAYFDGMRHDEAIAAFATLASHTEGEARCEALFMQGKAMLRKRDRETAARLLDTVAQTCTGEDVRAGARYHAGRALSQRGEHAAALAMFEALERDHPAHRLADDALYLGALRARELGDIEGMKSRLRALPTRYPTGDMRGEAAFALAQTLRRERAFDEAARTLASSIAAGTNEVAEDIRGRSEYWRARSLFDAGHRAEAIAAYDAAARQFPLSYYAQQSVARLDELDAPRARAIRETWTASSAMPAAIPRRDEMDAPGFTRAIELLRVGALERALRELSYVGLLAEDADESRIALAATVLDATGEQPEASRLVRRRLGSFLDDAPRGDHGYLWRIAYPKAFSPLLEEIATEAGIPPAFLRAIAREESQFNPRAVSIAHAYGLVQLIRPTARRFARELGLPSDEAALKRPEVNARIGARFMRFLFDRYGSNAALVPPSYNAGYGATDRWLRANAGQDLDEWVENIEFDETRRYTRRVLQTYGTYAWLDGEALPVLPRTLPAP